MAIDKEELAQQYANAESYFATLRSTLQLAPTTPNWEVIKSNVGYGTDVASWTYKEVIKHFTSRYMPYVEQGLSQWPDALRTVSLYDDQAVRDIGRILKIELPYQTTKKAIDAHVNTISHNTFTGLHCTSMNKHALYAVQSLCTQLSGPVTSLRLDFSPVRANPKRYELGAQGIQELLTWVFEQYGHTLESLGLQIDDHFTPKACVDAMWGTFFSYASELPNLRHLTIGQADGTQKDWGIEIFQDSRFDKLETLAECDLFYRFSRQTLMEREASLNLRRIKLYNMPAEVSHMLIRADNLQHVKTFELLPDTQDKGWGSSYAEHWEFEQQKLGDSPITMHPFLRQTQLNVEEINDEDLHEIFLDARQQLVPSDYLESLELRTMTPVLLEQLFSQGSRAYPNLKNLNLQYPVRVLFADYALMNQHHALLDQLEHCELYTSFFDERFVFRPDDVKLAPARLELWLGIALDDAFHRTLRFHAWQTFRREGPTQVKLLKLRANMLDIPHTSKLKKEELQDVIKEAIPPEIRPEYYY